MIATAKVHVLVIRDATRPAVLGAGVSLNEHVHRLGDVVIGHKCEVDNCLLPTMNGQSRCYEHSEDRLIEDLFEVRNVASTEQIAPCKRPFAMSMMSPCVKLPPVFTTASKWGVLFATTGGGLETTNCSTQ